MLLIVNTRVCRGEKKLRIYSVIEGHLHGYLHSAGRRALRRAIEVGEEPSSNSKKSSFEKKKAKEPVEQIEYTKTDDHTVIGLTKKMVGDAYLCSLFKQVFSSSTVQ